MVSTLKDRSAIRRASPQHWPGVGESGEVPIDSVMPSWDLNPRDYFDLSELEELADDIAQNGQLEQGTVRLTTEEERARYPGVRYILVSGERRWVSSKWIGKLTYDLRVKQYASIGREMLEAYLLNENRVRLCDLENAVYIGKVAEANGWNTQSEIAAGIGRDSPAGQVYVSQMLSILHCTSAVRDRMRPQLKPDDRLKRNVALLLSKLADKQQDKLIRSMPAECTTSVAQINWIKGQLHKDGVELPRRTRKPQGNRRMLGVLAKTISDKSKAILSETGLSRLFENTGGEEAEQLAVDMRNALIEFEKLVERVEDLSEGEKPVTALIAKQAAAPPKPRVEALSAPKPSELNRKTKTRSFGAGSGSIPQKSASRPLFSSTPAEEKQRPNGNGSANHQAEVFVQYWDSRSGRYASGGVTMHKYAELHDAGLLKFQREGTAKPDHYPDREDI